MREGLGRPGPSQSMALRLTNNTGSRRNVLGRILDVMPGQTVELSDDEIKAIKKNPVDSAEFLRCISGENPPFLVSK